jgi:hypothetical protein
VDPELVRTVLAPDGGDIIGHTSRNGISADGKRSVLVTINTDSLERRPGVPAPVGDVTTDRPRALPRVIRTPQRSARPGGWHLTSDSGLLAGDPGGDRRHHGTATTGKG